jgi:hypothetical protein
VDPIVLLTLLVLTIVLFGLCLLNTGAPEAAPADGHGHGRGGGDDHAAGHHDEPGEAATHQHH